MKKNKNLTSFHLWTRRTVRAILNTILAICLIFSLSSCGNKVSERTEDQISSDIQQRDDYINTYNLKVKSFSISKRQTNREDKNDFVWCEITAANDLFSYSAEYELTYVLYNDGWLLEECNQNSSSVTPVSPPTQTQDEAMALVLEYWDQHDHKDIFGHDIDTQRRISQKSSLQKESELSYVYYFQIAWKNRLGYDGPPSDLAVRYQFDLSSGWSSEITTADITWR